jgi:hypothetical protein
MSASTESDRRGLRRMAAELSQRAPVLVDAYRFMRNPSWQWAIARDLRETARAAKPLRDAARPSPDAPRAMIGLYRDDIFDAKLALLFGVALRSQGLEPLVLVPSRRASHVRAYAKRFGVDDIVDREGIELTADDRERIDRAVDEVSANAGSYEKLKAWRFDDHAAGYHLLSSVIRLTLEGAPDLDDPEVQELVRTVARDVATSYLRSERVLDRRKPQVVLVEEAGYSVN